MRTTMTGTATLATGAPTETGVGNEGVGPSGRAEMLGTLCHSLNQPLMAISGLSEIMAMQMADEDPLKPKMEKLTRQVAKMSEIVREIMTVSQRG